MHITIETCNPTTRDAGGGAGGGGGGGGGGGTAALPQVPQGKYSFIHKVVDGITIVVNTVNVNFVSAAFTASVQMSRIRVESKTPQWINADLRATRLKDAEKGIILIFKELSWQTVRIEASSTQDKSLTPLRLLTNHARCRITIRKRLADCTLLASRLVLILDDLLWVLTDSQLKAALHFVDSLSGLIKAATHATQKSKAARKLQVSTGTFLGFSRIIHVPFNPLTDAARVPGTGGTTAESSIGVGAHNDGTAQVQCLRCAGDIVSFLQSTH